MTLKQRNELLYQMTNDVADIVINDCYRQTQSISVSMLLGADQLKEYTRFIHALSVGKNSNSRFNLPSFSNA